MNTIKYDELLKITNEHLHNHFSGDVHAVFSAYKIVKYKEDGTWILTNSFFDIAIKGNIRIVQGGFISPILKDPTWADLLIQAEMMIRTTGERDRVFLESITQNKKQTGDGILDIELFMGK